MGDYFQTIVDRDASLDEAADLSLRIRDWLVDEGIIVATVTNSALGSSLIYPPGANFERAIDGTDHGTRTLIWNGLEIVVGRNVFNPGQGLPPIILCRRCGSGAYDFFDSAFTDAIRNWFEQEGRESLICPRCGVVESVSEWVFEPPWGFGNLGFKFWNWPPLKHTFLEEVADRLGHRVVVVSGKV